MFACTDLEILSRIEQDVHCAVLKEDPRFEVFSIIVPHLDPPEELVKVYLFNINSLAITI